MPKNEPEQLLLEIAILEEYHKSFKISLGKYAKTRKWAVWMLQGLAIALSRRAVNYQQNGDFLGVMLIARLMSETLSQTGYFANPNTKHEAIHLWMKTYAAGIYGVELTDIHYTLFRRKDKKGNLLYQHQRLRKLPDVNFDDARYNKDLNNLLSLYAHPSYDLARTLFHTDKNNGSYTLYETDKYSSPDGREYATRAIIEMASHTIHLGSYLYGEIITLAEIKDKFLNITK